jgi:hypothetical protein
MPHPRGLTEVSAAGHRYIAVARTAQKTPRALLLPHYLLPGKRVYRAANYQRPPLPFPLFWLSAVMSHCSLLKAARLNYARRFTISTSLR